MSLCEIIKEYYLMKFGDNIFLISESFYFSNCLFFLFFPIIRSMKNNNI